MEQAAADDGSATHVQAAAVLRAAGDATAWTSAVVDANELSGVVNADDLKRFVTYFWNEENCEVVEKDEAMRCLRAFLQVSDQRAVREMSVRFNLVFARRISWIMRRPT